MTTTTAAWLYTRCYSFNPDATAVYRVGGVEGLFGPSVKAGEVIEWRRTDYGLGCRHATAIVHVLKHGANILDSLSVKLNRGDDRDDARVSPLRQPHRALTHPAHSLSISRAALRKEADEHGDGAPVLGAEDLRDRRTCMVGLLVHHASP